MPLLFLKIGKSFLSFFAILLFIFLLLVFIDQLNKR